MATGSFVAGDTAAEYMSTVAREGVCRQSSRAALPAIRTTKRARLSG